MWELKIYDNWVIKKKKNEKKRDDEKGIERPLIFYLLISWLQKC